MHDGPALVRGDVDRRALLALQHLDPGDLRERQHVPHRVAVERLDLDHPGAEVGEQRGADTGRRTSTASSRHVMPVERQRTVAAAAPSRRRRGDAVGLGRATSASVRRRAAGAGRSGDCRRGRPGVPARPGWRTGPRSGSSISTDDCVVHQLGVVERLGVRCGTASAHTSGWASKTSCHSATVLRCTAASASSPRTRRAGRCRRSRAPRPSAGRSNIQSSPRAVIIARNSRGAVCGELQPAPVRGERDQQAEGERRSAGPSSRTAASGGTRRGSAAMTRTNQSHVSCAANPATSDVSTRWPRPLRSRSYSAASDALERAAARPGTRSTARTTNGGPGRGVIPVELRRTRRAWP